MTSSKDYYPRVLPKAKARARLRKVYSEVHSLWHDMYRTSSSELKYQIERDRVFKFLPFLCVCVCLN